MKVLVVDDDIVSRMVLMHLIDACGDFDILEADDGEDAWQQLSGGAAPAICFCDLRMPRLSGMELLQRVKGDPTLTAMPFVLVTSASDHATIEQANGLGADGYLIKPFDGTQVKAFLAPLVAAEPAPEPEAEAPLATMARLGIDGERLQAYLGGFHTQLAGASGELAALLANDDHDAARVRLDRLHAGCLTLGLNSAASAIRDFPDGPLDGTQVQIVLAETVRAVMAQSEALRRLQA
ncbi:MAG TPA: response regulator [Telluria sp.]|jgi:two-component system chemotaxis response regulator CheY